MKKFAFITLLASVVVVSGCAGSKQRSITPPATDKVIKAAPDWYLSTPEDPNYLFAPASATSVDMQMAMDKAADMARADIAKQMETKMSGMSKRFQEEVGTGADAQYLDMFTQAYKAVISTELTGTSIAKREVQNEGGIFRAYVLVKMPVGAASQALMSRIKQQEQLYTKFRASQVFEDLDNEVKAYEEWKANQGTGR